MTTRELKKLNKYPEFESNSDIDEIIDFITSDYNDYPERLITQRQRNRYFEKFGVASHFEVRIVNGAPTQMDAFAHVVLEGSITPILTALTAVLNS